MKPVITLKNVSVNFGARHALQNVSGSFQAGSLTAVAGPNGSGKSTLLKVIAGILKPSMGGVIFEGGKPPTISYLPQASHLQRDFPITVEEVVLTGFYPALGEKIGFNTSHHAAASEALHEVGLTGYENRPVSELSGGEFQRVLFARIIIQDASIVLLDEPFTAIDAATTAKLIRLLLKWHKEQRTIICVLHDLLLIKKYFPESMVLQGKCLGSGHTHEMFDQKLLSFDLDMAQLIPADESSEYGHAGHHDH